MSSGKFDNPNKGYPKIFKKQEHIKDWYEKNKSIFSKKTLMIHKIELVLDEYITMEMMLKLLE